MIIVYVHVHAVSSASVFFFLTVDLSADIFVFVARNAFLITCVNMYMYALINMSYPAKFSYLTMRSR